MPKKIVINLPDSGIAPSIMKGINKRISMMENFVRDGKKKKKDSELNAMKKQLNELTSLKGAMHSRELKDIKFQTGAISQALSALGKIRIPSPS